MSVFTTNLSFWFEALRRSLSHQHGVRRMSGAFIDRVWHQVTWLERRLLRAVARVDAGIPPRIRRSGPKPGMAAPAAETHRADPQATDPPVPALPRRPPAPRKLRLPRREGWLLPLMPAVMLYQWVLGAGAHGHGLTDMLTAPEAAPYLAHPSIVRQLRPLCRMLGVSHLLPPKPPRTAALHEAPSAPPEATAAPPPATPPPMPSMARPLRRRRPTSHPPPGLALTFR